MRFQIYWYVVPLLNPKKYKCIQINYLLNAEKGTHFVEASYCFATPTESFNGSVAPQSTVIPPS